VIRKASVSSADAVIIILLSINTEYRLVGSIRECELGIPMIVMYYCNYDPSTPYLGVATTRRDFHSSAVGGITSQDPEYAFLTRLIIDTTNYYQP
jgi:hypothetical protein